MTGSISNYDDLFNYIHTRVYNYLYPNIAEDEIQAALERVYVDITIPLANLVEVMDEDWQHYLKSNARSVNELIDSLKGFNNLQHSQLKWLREYRQQSSASHTPNWFHSYSSLVVLSIHLCVMHPELFNINDESLSEDIDALVDRLFDTFLSKTFSEAFFSQLDDVQTFKSSLLERFDMNKLVKLLSAIGALYGEEKKIAEYMLLRDAGLIDDSFEDGLQQYNANIHHLLEGKNINPDSVLNYHGRKHFILHEDKVLYDDSFKLSHENIWWRYVQQLKNILEREGGDYDG